MVVQQTPAHILKGRRERDLLAFPSVQRMADVLSVRCREPSWVRTSVASLGRFRTMTDHDDLEALLDEARLEPVVAEEALLSFARALGGRTESQIAALAIGPKIWFRLNGVPVPWRPLPGVVSPPPLRSGTDHDLVGHLVLLALIGSGLHRAELLRLRVDNVGSLDADGCLIPDVEAHPLAIQHTPRRFPQIERITFFTYQARQALLMHLERRAQAGQTIGLDAPLIAQCDGSPATASSVARAVHLNSSLIHTVSDVNLELCMMTGNFFRAWGLPGSRFAGPEEFNMEDFE
jgi:hypothetical protein